MLGTQDDTDEEEEEEEEEEADVTSASQDCPPVLETVDSVPSPPAPRNTVRILPPQPALIRPAKQNNGESSIFKGYI